MRRLFLLPGGARKNAAVEAWFEAHDSDLGKLAKHWFDVVRDCGDDVGVLLHDGHPTACVADAAFAYVNAYTAHINVGFFNGAELEDKGGLLEGTGKFMRHVKLKPADEINAAALTSLIESAYTEMRNQLRQE